jgi:hypothetical protein
MKALRAANKLYKQKIAEEKRAERERARGVREKEKAAKAAEQRRQREERNLQKAIQTSQRGKRRGSQAPAPKKQAQKSIGWWCSCSGARTARISAAGVDNVTWPQRAPPRKI